MTPEEAYEEALCRIREAEEAGALELDLSGIEDSETGAQAFRNYSRRSKINPQLFAERSVLVGRHSCEQMLDHIFLPCMTKGHPINRECAAKVPEACYFPAHGQVWYTTFDLRVAGIDPVWNQLGGLAKLARRIGTGLE
jgi:hypothetical protein